MITIEEVLHDSSHELGVDPGLVKDGVEAHLQELLAAHSRPSATGWTLVRREYPTAIGPVDLLCRDADGRDAWPSRSSGAARSTASSSSPATWSCSTATRCWRPVRGVFAAQEIKPQARVLAADRGIGCVTLDYDVLKGIDDPSARLF